MGAQYGMARFATSHLGLLVGCEVLTLVALILFVVALCAGMSRGLLERIAILTVDTSSLITSVASTSAPAIKEWYEAHYLSICSGMWNGHIASAGKNHSTITCTSQSAGYTFSPARLIGGDAGQQFLLASHRTLDTKAPFILLVLGIASMGLTILSFLYGIVALRSITRRRQLTKKEMPLVVLRIGFFACIASTIFLTISSAKITASAGKMTGRVQIGGGQAIHAWMDGGFYAVTWIGMAFVWVALGLVVAAAFKIAVVLESRGVKASQIGPPGSYK